MKITRPLAASTLLLASATLPGCIAWDIKDGIEQTNANLDTINQSFTMVEQTNERLDRIDANLKATEERIATLQATLESVEASLLSLRKTINNIDSTIPFLSFSGDDDEEKEALQTEEVPETPPTQDSAEIQAEPPPA